MPPDPATSTARSRRSRSRRTVPPLDYPQPLIEFARLERLDVGLDQFGQLSRFARRHVASRLPSYMVPASIRVVEQLPKTSTGKIDRPLLTERAKE